MIGSYLLFKLILRAILGKERPLAASVSMTPVIVFLVVMIVALATIYDGMRNLIARGSPLMKYLSGPRALVVSGAIALVAAFVAWLLVRRTARAGADLSLPEQLGRVERVLSPLVILTSSCVAFAHGANDVANAVGPVAAVFDILKSGTVKMSVEVPSWVLALGGAGIVLGLATYGHKVIRTIGSNITELTPSRALASDISTTATVLVCTRLGLPISTTHTIVGAILGVGLARGLGAVNRRVVRNICGSWLATVPAAAGMSMLLFVLGQSLGVHTLLKQLMPQASP